MFRSLFALGVMGIGVLGATASQDLWDLDWAKTAPLEVEVISESTREVDGIPMIARELSYLSHEWRGASIRIAGHLAFPASAKEQALPGLILVTSGSAKSISQPERVSGR